MPEDESIITSFTNISQNHLEKIETISSMGFGFSEAEIALLRSVIISLFIFFQGRDVQSAVEWLLDNSSKASSLVKERDEKDQQAELAIKLAEEEKIKKEILNELQRKENQLIKDAKDEFIKYYVSFPLFTFSLFKGT